MLTREKVIRDLNNPFSALMPVREESDRENIFMSLILSALKPRPDRMVGGEFHALLVEALKTEDTERFCVLVAKYIRDGKLESFRREFPIKRIVAEFMPKSKTLIAEAEELHDWVIAYEELSRKTQGLGVDELHALLKAA